MGATDPEEAMQQDPNRSVLTIDPGYYTAEILHSGKRKAKPRPAFCCLQYRRCVERVWYDMLFAELFEKRSL